MIVSPINLRLIGLKQQGSVATALPFLIPIVVNVALNHYFCHFHKIAI